MRANSVVSVNDEQVSLAAVPAVDVVRPAADGSAPRQGYSELGELDGVGYGVWCITEGVVQDVEDEEVFVVTSGAAKIVFPEEDREIEVGPGDIVRLAAGTRTVWHVPDHLRKVYFA